MDFFNKLGKKATETINYTKEKATTLTEELKLKGKIGELNEANNKLFVEIGKKVYEEINDGKDVLREDVVEKTEQISRNKEEISKIETQILALKKLKICESCGAELDIEVEFCPKCGKQQPKIEKVEIKNEEPANAEEAEVVEENSDNQ